MVGYMLLENNDHCNAQPNTHQKESGAFSSSTIFLAGNTKAAAYDITARVPFHDLPMLLLQLLWHCGLYAVMPYHILACRRVPPRV